MNMRIEADFSHDVDVKIVYEEIGVSSVSMAE